MNNRVVLIGAGGKMGLLKPALVETLAVLFEELPGAVFSHAANKALQRGLKEFIREDWKKVFEEDNV